MQVPGFAVQGVVLDIDGVLTDGSLCYAADGELFKVTSARDGLGMAMLRDAGVRIAVVSGRKSPSLAARLAELGVSTVHFARMDKAEALQQVCAEWSVDPSQLAAMGDDLVDIPMLRRVGFSAAPADADPRVRAMVRHVCASGGGRGAVRELCELVLRSRGDWAAVAERFETGEVS